MTQTTKIIIFCILALGFLFVGTQPDKLPSLMLVMPFLLFFVLFLAMARWLFVRMGMNHPRNTGLSMLLAGLPVVLLALQSLGQLTLRDVIMLSALFAITYFYMYRRAQISN